MVVRDVKARYTTTKTVCRTTTIKINENKLNNNKLTIVINTDKWTIITKRANDSVCSTWPPIRRQRRRQRERMQPSRRSCACFLISWPAQISRHPSRKSNATAKGALTTRRGDRDGRNKLVVYNMTAEGVLSASRKLHAKQLRVRSWRLAIGV